MRDRFYFNWIPLNACECNIIESTADFIRKDVQQRHLQKGHGSNVRARFRDLCGVAAEYLFTTKLGIPFNGNWNTFHQADVAGVEVRGTWTRTGHLICYETDPPDRVLMSVWVAEDLSGGYVKGHQLARVCRQPAYLKSLSKLQPGSAKQWWFPDDGLQHEITMEDLLERYAIERCEV